MDIDQRSQESFHKDTKEHAIDLLRALFSCIENERGNSEGLSLDKIVYFTDEIGERWKEAARLKDPLINRVYHFAHHYLADEDIMKSSQEYRAAMNRQLLEFIRELEGNE